MTSQVSCIAHMKFTCELTWIENPNEHQLDRKSARLITSPAHDKILAQPPGQVKKEKIYSF
uniref:SFRICE_014661 n=1 Tax=Spodoptera frugiperda TaxID=7108 RepID=A0A2H1V1W3_SPOFR